MNRLDIYIQQLLEFSKPLLRIPEASHTLKLRGFVFNFGRRHVPFHLHSINKLEISNIEFYLRSKEFITLVDFEKQYWILTDIGLWSIKNNQPTRIDLTYLQYGGHSLHVSGYIIDTSIHNPLVKEIADSINTYLNLAYTTGIYNDNFYK